MGFIGLFLLIILVIILVISVIFLIASITLFIVSNIKLKKSDSKVFRIVRIVCLPVMCISIIPSVILSIIIVVNLIHAATIPSNYIEAEEVLYLDNYEFTTSEERFIEIGDMVLYDYDGEGTPEFSYKVNGTFNKYKWRNIYGYELESGFTVYKFEINFASIFYYVNENEYDEFYDYYLNNSYWEFEKYNNAYSDKLSDIYNKYLLTEEAAYKIPNGDYILDYFLYSNDQIFRIRSYEVIKAEDSKYYLLTYRKSEIGEDGLSYLRGYGFELTPDEVNIIISYCDEGK